MRTSGFVNLEKTCLTAIVTSTLLCILFSPLATGQSSDRTLEGLQEAWRVGEDDDEVLFSGIGSVALDSQGRVYVTDWLHPSVYVFSEVGVLLDEIGRQGEGPGEFVQVGNVFIGGGDSLFVHDRQTNRISQFTPTDHTFAGRIRLPFLGSSYAPRNLLGATRGEFIVSYVHFLVDGADNQANRITPVYAVDRSTGLLTRLSPITRVKDLGSMVISSRDGGHSMTANPFRVHPTMCVSTQERMYFLQGDTRAIAVHDGDGTFKDSLRWNRNLVPFTSDELRDTLHGYSRRWRRHMRKIGLPEFKPAAQTFVVDDQEHIWIQLSLAEGESMSIWIVLDQTGVEVDALELPANVRLMAIRNGKAVGVLKSEDGADRLISYTVL